MSDHWGLAHEFMHGVQSVEGGMACNQSNTCGWVYESHANWAAQQQTQYHTSDVHCSELLVNATRLYLGSTRDRYCNWQFMEYLKDKYCFSAVNAIWTGKAAADPFTAIMNNMSWNLGQLNDFMGEWATHNITWDYQDPAPESTAGGNQGALFRRNYGMPARGFRCGARAPARYGAGSATRPACAAPAGDDLPVARPFGRGEGGRSAVVLAGKSRTSPVMSLRSARSPAHTFLRLFPGSPGSSQANLSYDWPLTEPRRVAMRSKTTCLCALVAIFGILLAGCGSKSGSSGSGGAVGTGGQPGTGGKTGTGGSASGGVASTTTQVGAGGKVGTGGSALGGASGTGGATGDASVTPTGDGSVGCGVSGAPTGNLSAQSITVGDKTRTYALTVPKNYSPSTPLPLIFAWHGMGGSGSVARSYFHIDSAVANRAIVVYPDGLPVGDGGTGWDLSSTGIDVAFFDALLAYVSNTYCIDRNRVFTTGHSFGGFFTNILGCYRGDVLRATAPVAGMPPSTYGRGTVTCAGNVAAIVIHGSNDPTVDYTQGGVGGANFWATQNGCSTTINPVPITPSACVEYQSCQPDLPVVFCTHTEGHDWPTANGSGCSDGGICFDAGSVIWTFFTRFQ